MGAIAAPRVWAASSAISISSEFGARMATTSPRLTLSERRPAATPRRRASSADQERSCHFPEGPRERTAARDGSTAARAAISCGTLWKGISASGGPTISRPSIGPTLLPATPGDTIRNSPVPTAALAWWIAYGVPEYPEDPEYFLLHRKRDRDLAGQAELRSDRSTADVDDVLALHVEPLRVLDRVAGSRDGVRPGIRGLDRTEVLRRDRSRVGRRRSGPADLQGLPGWDGHAGHGRVDGVHPGVSHHDPGHGAFAGVRHVQPEVPGGHGGHRSAVMAGGPDRK